MVQLPTDQWEHAKSAIDLCESFSKQISSLIEYDFEQLAQLFYRVDVDETRVKANLLQHQGEDSGEFVANEILSREYQKVIFRMQFSGELKDNDNS